MKQLYLDKENYKEAVFLGKKYDAKKKGTQASRYIKQLSTKFNDMGYAATRRMTARRHYLILRRLPGLGSAEAQFRCCA